MRHEKGFEELLLEAAAKQGPPSYPMFHYDPDGDFVEVIMSGEGYHGERVDGRLTIYRGDATGRIVGAVVKDVKKMLSEQPEGFRVDVCEGGKLRVAAVFAVHLWHSPDDLTRFVYRLLRDKANEVDAEVEMATA